MPALAWLQDGATGVRCTSREGWGEKEPEEEKDKRQRNTARKKGLRYKLLLGLLSLCEELAESN